MPRGTAVLFVLAAVTACAEQRYDIVLRGGRVMDPVTGLDSILDVGIRGDTIAAIAAGPLNGTTVVDVSGLVVAPGFIDLHAHGQTASDLALKARDGVTTALEMEIGVYPVASWYESMAGIGAVINYGATVSHPTARMALFHGLEVGHWPTNRQAVAALGPVPQGANMFAEQAQVDSLGVLLRRGLDEGALGVGFGINYSPGALRDEIEAMFRVAAERRVPAYVHTRAFGFEPIQEAVSSARRAGSALHIVHIGSSAGDSLPEALAYIDSAKNAGQDVTTEVYPYTAASTLIESAMFNPGWRANLKVDYGDVAWAETGERLTAQSFERYRAQGGWVIIYMMKEPNIERAIAHPGVMIASDGVPFENGKGHPRGAGTYARVLGHYVRENELLPLMDALAKMTILPAQRLETYVPAMRKKGRLAVGADADIAVFDPATVIDRATFVEPTVPSDGIPHVIVAGVFVVRDGEPVPGVAPGRAVRVR